MKYISFTIDRDVEKSHGAGLALGDKLGINFSLQWRSWESNENGYDPWYVVFRIFVWGTFLGFNPHRDLRCCSNGIQIFELKIYPEPHIIDLPWPWTIRSSGVWCSFRYTLSHWLEYHQLCSKCHIRFGGPRYQMEDDENPYCLKCCKELETPEWAGMEDYIRHKVER